MQANFDKEQCHMVKPRITFTGKSGQIRGLFGEFVQFCDISGYNNAINLKLSTCIYIRIIISKTGLVQRNTHLFLQEQLTQKDKDICN